MKFLLLYGLYPLKTKYFISNSVMEDINGNISYLQEINTINTINNKSLITQLITNVNSSLITKLITNVNSSSLITKFSVLPSYIQELEAPDASKHFPDVSNISLICFKTKFEYFFFLFS